MFFVELLASRYDMFGAGWLGITREKAYGPVSDLIRAWGPAAQWRRQQRDSIAMQMTALFILEFGIIFHSIFIGLTLAVSGEEFVVLYIVLGFHQTFEEIGLGSRLAIALWPPDKAWLLYALGGAYALSTLVPLAAGLGVREILEPESSTTLIVNGVFDSVSAGILVYTELVELMAHEFMFNTEMRRSGIGTMLTAFACMCLGAGLMALLGKWALKGHETTSPDMVVAYIKRQDCKIGIMAERLLLLWCRRGGSNIQEKKILSLRG
ncbi:Zinc-regulated transporter 1 [Fusarium keratoplasticum]|nr:Zinc-regulated transporter 1 [Fusarium keratoplasticum]